MASDSSNRGGPRTRVARWNRPPRPLPPLSRGSTIESVPRGATWTTSPRADALSALLITLARHQGLVFVLSLYAASALVVPTMTPAPVSDDWVYARSVEILLRDGDLRILDLSVVTLVFQVVWGAFFSLLFGLSFGAMRLSTIALTFLAGWALYGLCRELAVSRSRSALATAAYLFNPLAFVLSFSFMTDPQFTALLIIATRFYVRGLRPDRPDIEATLVGSGMAALAFLVRQQGALIPLAVVIYLLMTGRLTFRPTHQNVRCVATVVAIPTAATALYYLWLLFVHGVPVQQESFTQAIADAGWSGSLVLLAQMTYIEAMYLGAFALPIVAAAIFIRRPVPASATEIVNRLNLGSRWGWILLGGWTALLATGLVIFGQDGRRMPYIPQFFGLVSGLGPADLWWQRPRIFNDNYLTWFTAACALASFVLVLALCRRVGAPSSSDRAAAGLVLAIALWQVFGIMPPSYHFRNWIISVDRYLLPLLPFAICLGFWALRDIRLNLPVAWLMVAVFAVFSVAGTRDFLVLQEATWAMARDTYIAGVPLTQIDGGSSWDGYYLWEYSDANNIPRQTPHGPWWTNLFAHATDSTYIISTTPYVGEVMGPYDVIGVREYSSWLHNDPVYLFLLRRAPPAELAAQVP
ncbi:MAG: glycosyltransferase family 39 protein [Chloroflexota bacterium]|nr:glycosyltransferase family 39 protein [Chloroflexota bacterium]